MLLNCISLLFFRGGVKTKYLSFNQEKIRMRRHATRIMYKLVRIIKNDNMPFRQNAASVNSWNAF